MNPPQPIEDNGGLVRGHYAFSPKKKIPASVNSDGVDLRGNLLESPHCVSARNNPLRCADPTESGAGIVNENPTSQQAAVKNWFEDEWFLLWERLATASRQA